MNIRSITILQSGARVIVTEDDATHRIAADAPDAVANLEIACGTAYPFTDDENGNAVEVSGE